MLQLKIMMMKPLKNFYEQIQSAVSYSKSCDIICIMGNLNAKVGNVKDSKIIGNYGLGKQNERGQRLIEFGNENNMVIMNTWFQQPLLLCMAVLYVILKAV